MLLIKWLHRLYWRWRLKRADYSWLSFDPNPDARCLVHYEETLKKLDLMHPWDTI